MGVIPLFLLFLSIEFALRLFYPVDEKSWSKKNAYEWSKERYCPFSDAIKLDPYLGYVWDRNSKCNTFMKVNNVGLEGIDFPIRKNPKEYVVLLIGGSVAHRLGNQNQEGLIKFFADRHKGKNIRLIVGAHGAWGYPQQFHLFTRFAPLVDAVISLDGFNETLQIVDTFNPFGSFSWYFIVKDRMQKSLRFRLIAFLYRRLEEYKEKQSCGRSHLCHFTLERSRDFLLKNFIYKHEKGPAVSYPSVAYENINSQLALELNLKQYINYLRMTDFIARGYKIDVYHFLQPVPALKKELTTEEKSVADVSKDFKLENYRGKYLEIEKAFLALRKENIKVYSLVPIFSNIKNTVYIDHIHLNKLGNQVLTKAITESISI